ncbi:MAG: WYL domain-containing protein [Oscillospiraceae bacterium]|nr:WYL domain-containing protein [Oscillospiraceae bacterium]
MIYPKKMMCVAILQILFNHTDANHPISLKELTEILLSEYGIMAERKSVARNLKDLAGVGFPVCSGDDLLKDRTEECTKATKYWIKKEFTGGELHILIDGIRFMGMLSPTQVSDLLSKVGQLGEKHFHIPENVRSAVLKTPTQSGVVYNVETIDEAISKGVMVTFNYYRFGTDKKRHYRLNNDGTTKIYTASPYELVAANGRYYLVCRFKGHNDIANIRLDMIANPVLTEMPIVGSKREIDIPTHLAEHLYMFSGKSIDVVFRADKSQLNAVIDWFGTEVEFIYEDDSLVEAKVKVNRTAMLYWALQFGKYVEVLYPQDLRNEIAQAVSDMHIKYSSQAATHYDAVPKKSS